MRARSSFGVVLHSHQGFATVPESFQGPVVQICVCELNLAGLERIGINRESVVLRGDLNASGPNLFDGMIPAVMPEFQFVGPPTKRQPQTLMTKADSEDRGSTNELANVVLSVCDRFGVARPVGK